MGALALSVFELRQLNLADGAASLNARATVDVDLQTSVHVPLRALALPVVVEALAHLKA